MLYAHHIIAREDAGAILAKLYEGSALCWEGMSDDPGNLDAIVKALEACGSAPNEHLEFYSISGHIMNEHYDLTGANAYPGDLTILCCPLEGFDSYEALITWRFTCGGRWFDDVVDNNEAREERR